MTADERESVTAPEYEGGNLLRPDLATARRALLREKFGRVRTYFKANADRYGLFQQVLNQARLGVSYDVYFARSVAYASLAGVVGAAAGTMLAIVLSRLGFIAELQSPIRMTGDLALFVSVNRTMFVGAVLALCTMFVFAAVTWIARYYVPHAIANARRRSIDIMLPHAIVYMYALSFGGMTLFEILRQMAAADDTYDEVAIEVGAIVRDVDLFGSDLRTAVRNTRHVTPSLRLETFLDDLLGVIDSGGDVTEFLYTEGEKYMDEAQSEQDSFLETLGTMSEVFIVAFVAAPLFLVITLIMTTLLGGGSFFGLFVVVYAVLPLGIAGFLVLVSTLSYPYREPTHRMVDDAGEREPNAAVRSDPRFSALRSVARRHQLRELIADPFELLQRQPLYTLSLSVPAGIGVVLLTHASGLPADSTAFLHRPYATTLAYVVAPLGIVAVPLTLFHELKRRRDRHVARRLPDVLDVLSSANGMGVPLVAALDIVARNATGRFAVELRHLRNDVEWNHDLRMGLYGLADRLQVPQLTRTCRILGEGSRSTGDLHRVLDVAAEDTRHRHRLERSRRQELDAYVAVVVIGFLVYVSVLVVIDFSFLTPMLGVVPESGGDADGLPFAIGAGTVGVYHAVFFHSALIQAVGTGLITGQLADNNALSGLKYSLALVAVALVVFLVI